MTTQGFEARLAQLGIELPKAVAPAANYVPARKSGALIYIAGQVPTAGGKDQYVGKVGQDVSIENAQKAARLCAINILAQLRTALGGSLDGVAGCVRLGGFVNSTPEFGDHPKVINGASDLMVEVFGEAGRHARAAVGCNSLPRNVAVEVDAIFELA
ncbi:RidA family protein [Variovorax sp. LjRoot130]|uniref:RidA family protein n=1 Tax=Variovorax sp. LjRoot130 TaxID=3342261 RepID=UPI003ECF6018